MENYYAVIKLIESDVFLGINSSWGLSPIRMSCKIHHDVDKFSSWCRYKSIVMYFNFHHDGFLRGKSVGKSAVKGVKIPLQGSWKLLVECCLEIVKK